MAPMQPGTTCLSPACQRTMWSSKMTACSRGEDGNLNTGNSGFLSGNTPDQLVLSQRGADSVEMDTQSCMDHSILAIFEDSTVVSEDKSGVEEESATLLSALTEMLDSVEDDDGTLSPFDTLPDTKLLAHPEDRDNSMEQFLADRLRSRSKGTKFTIKEDELKNERCAPPQLLKQQSQTVIQSMSKKADTEVRVFSSTSLANLVRIMHSYCLRLHVEEEVGGKVGRDHTLFSQEEVWKYERPSEESDEEINVVSDDEATVKETKEEGDDGKRLKGVLLNGKSSRASPSGGKKRVSFGAVQVASFDQSVGKGLEEKYLKGESVSATLNTKASKDPADSAPKAHTPSSESSNKKTEVLAPKGETKAKSLSLQQYRQLRQRRKPLVEKQGNNTTKWPSVPETPKELTPILCLQGQRQVRCAPKTLPYSDGKRGTTGLLQWSQTPAIIPDSTSSPPRPHPPEDKPSPQLPRSVLKRPRVDPRVITPVSPLPFVTESKSSPVKKVTLLSSDPPNPVLLPLPVIQTPPPAADHSSPESRLESPHHSPNPDSARHFQELQSESSGQSLQLTLQPKPEVLLGDQHSPILIQESETKPSEIPAGVSSIQTKSSSECEQPQPQPQQCRMNLKRPEPKTLLSSQTSVPIAAPSQVKEKPASQEQSSPDSVIEAADVTSLLEQFEETQAKEEKVEPKLDAESLSSHLPTDGLSPSTGTSLCRPPSTTDSQETPKPLRNTHQLQTSEAVLIPEPSSTEIVLSSQPELPSRRRNPPSKAIQIIDPRPLPSKRMHSHFPEFPAAHTYAAVCLDHDYCCPVDRSATSSPQRLRASKLRENSKDTDESQVITNNSAADCKQQTSTCAANTTTGTVVSQHLPEGPRTISGANLSTHGPVLPPPDSAPREVNDKPAPCTPPTPPPSPPDRGRDRKRYRRSSPLSDSSSSTCSSSSSSSSSRSRSPKRQKRRYRRSESSSCSSSCSSSASRSPPRRHYRLSYSRSRCSRSRSRSRSWSRSRSRSRSRSPSSRFCSRQWRHFYGSRESRKIRREHEVRIQKLKAIDERRVVYVGRICRSMTHDELRQRFSQFGEVECVSLHFRDRGDHYGFVTFYNMKDAFTAIDNSGKLRRPDELPFDICFGGRRQFCNSDYADLDADRDTEPSPANSGLKDVDFDSLLKQAQRGLKR